MYMHKRFPTYMHIRLYILNYFFIIFYLLLRTRLILSLYYCFIYASISADIDIDILKMNDSTNPGGNQSGGTDPGNNQGGGPNHRNNGPDWKPFQYEHPVKEDGSNYETPYRSTVPVLETYNPGGDIPDASQQNDRQLGVLVNYRFDYQFRSLGYRNWNIEKMFPSDNLVDNMAKQRLIAHIFDHRSDLPSAYRQLDLISGTPKLGSVRITSYLINSLNRSSN